jgi:zinc protease
VTRLTRSDLVAFRDRHLVGRNGVLAVFGKVCVQEVQRLAERELGGETGLPAGEAALEQPQQPDPLRETLSVEKIQDKEQALLMVGYQGADLYSSDRVALDVIDEACSDLGSRFFIRIREQMGLAYFVGTSHGGGLARGAFVFYLGTDPLKLTAVRAEFLDEIRLLARDGLTDEELARAKEKLIGAQDIGQQSNARFAFSCAIDELYGLGFGYYLKRREAIAALTLEEVREVAKRYFEGQNFVVAVVKPA